ncbi:MAG: CDP-alcohol phosphatidyltransferase family protein [Phycisphaeraceae bacterium]|nr:CDP-alcohol phosphatidyltransferase family protein [Phycisphaeraceae bacterium]
MPNLLTLARLILAGALITLLSLWRYPKLDDQFSPPTGPMLWAALLFGLGALTDLLDGLLARRWGVISKFGRIMDPFADKLLVVGAFAMMAGPAFDCQLSNGKALQVSGVMPWMALVILSRELLVTAIRAVLEAHGIDFSASLSGKAKMTVQCGCILGVFLILAFANPMPLMLARKFIDAMVWTAVIVTALSIIPYAVRAAQAGASHQ